MDNYGFIIIRHVNSEKTNKYWNQSVKCLRKLYPLKKIVVIDDNSNPTYLKSDFDYKNLEIIQSEFKGRGELLPYYYYLKNKFFENAIILHDSVFFHKRYAFENIVDKIKVMPLWYFHADTENLMNTFRITNKLKNSAYIQDKLSLNFNLIGMNHNKWYGCFGVQSFINHDFLTDLEKKYRISRLVEEVKCRADRCCLERIFGCLFFIENNNILKKKSLLGNIHLYHKWGYNYDQYEKAFYSGKVPRPIIKVWTGR